MNIKSVTGPVIPQEIKKVDRRAHDSNPDREPSHQGDGGQQERKKLSDEQIQAAIDYLKSLSGVKDSNLNVRLSREDGTVVVFVEDLSGKVIRRIPENDLWSLLQNQDKSKGHLFDKAM